VSAADGKGLVTYRLGAMPVFDGMAAAHGRLYLSMADGHVLCLGGGEGSPLVLAPHVVVSASLPAEKAAPPPGKGAK
jgi:hypothetical protein